LKKILFVGSFSNSLNVKGGQNTASILLYEALKNEFKISKIDSTMISIPPPNIFVRTVNAIKRICQFIILAPKSKSIIIFSADGLSFIEKGLMAIIGKIMMKKVLFCPRSGYFLDELNNSNFKKIYLLIVAYCSRYIICQSQFWKKELIKFGIRGEKLIVINNWIDAKNNKKIIADKKPLKFIYLGWITKEKGIFDLLDALKEFKSEDFLFQICGDGKDFLKIKDKIKYLNQKNIILEGWVDKLNKTKIMDSGDVFLFPSHSEGFPNVLLEAMQHKLCIIASDTTSIPDIIKHKKNGLLFHRKDVNMLKKMIVKSQDFHLRKKLAKKGYDDLLERFNIENAKRKFMDII
tara:strand:- start:14687 stop:15733 length:1047 start_codon:yes stop_codon:yes gene_type:complete